MGNKLFFILAQCKFSCELESRWVKSPLWDLIFDSISVSAEVIQRSSAHSILFGWIICDLWKGSFVIHSFILIPHPQFLNYDYNSAPQSKNAVSTFQITYRVLSFVMVSSWMMINPLPWLKGVSTISYICKYNLLVWTWIDKKFNIKWMYLPCFIFVDTAFLLCEAELYCLTTTKGPKWHSCPESLQIYHLHTKREFKWRLMSLHRHRQRMIIHVVLFAFYPSWLTFNAVLLCTAWEPPIICKWYKHITKSNSPPL